MIFLGFGKYVRADKIYALEPLADGERGHGARTRVWVEGIGDPIIASRTERAIVAAMGSNPRSRARRSSTARSISPSVSPTPPSRAASTSSTWAAARGGCSHRLPPRPTRRACSDEPALAHASVSGGAKPLTRRFFDRDVHAVARELVGARAARRRGRRDDRRGRGVLARRSRVARVPRPDAEERRDVRARRARVRLPLLRHPLVPELRLRAGRARERSS